MIEILVVMAIMFILLALSSPFVTSLQSDIAIRKTVRQVKTDLVTNIGYSLAGKSITALYEDDLTNPELMPSHYALYFKSYDEHGDYSPYSYIEMRADASYGADQIARKLYQVEKEIPTSVVYLKEIRINNNTSSAEVDSAYIIFTPPFGKVYLVSGSTYKSFAEGDADFNLTDALEESGGNTKIEFDFQYKDDEHTLTTLTFSTDKIINIL